MKWRFISALMGVTLIVLLVLVIPLGFYLERVEHERIITALERDAFSISQRIEESIETTATSDDQVLEQIARSYNETGGARVVIVNSEGTVLALSDDDQRDLGSSFASRPEIQAALSGEVSSGHRFSQTVNQELLYVAVPIVSGDTVLGAVRFTYPDSVITTAVNAQLWMLTTVTVISVLVAGVIGYLMAISITRRITVLQQATEKLAAGDLSARADADHGPIELQALSRSFNNMATKLDALVKQQQRFAADASHQLRTPLTALRLKLERAQDLINSDPQAAAQRLAAAETETVRLNNVIEGLLLLSRTESSVVPTEQFDLSELAAQRVAVWESLCEEKGVTLSFAQNAPAQVIAVPGAVEQVIDNLIDNALDASSTGTEIAVQINTGPATTTLHVMDQGVGLTPEECVRAFDRFWRVKSDEHGSGLGLPIVAELMAASGGSAQLKPRQGGGIDASASFVSG